MNRYSLSAITLALAALTTGHALAADASVAKTREQVQAELAEVQVGPALRGAGDAALELLAELGLLGLKHFFDSLPADHA